MKTDTKINGLLLLAAFLLFISAANSQPASTRGTDSVDIYIAGSDYVKALDHADRLSKKYKASKNWLGFSKNAVKKSEIYFLLNDNEKALTLLFGALKTVRSRSEKTGEILILRKLGAIYSDMQDYNTAKKYYYAALNLSRKIKNDSLTQALNQPLYKVHALTGNDSARYYLKRTMAYNKRIGTPEALTTAYNNYFFYYHKLENGPMAKKYLDSAAYFARKSESKQKLRIILVNLAAYYTNEKKYREAKKLYQEVFAINPSDTLTMEVSDYYYTYSDILFNLGEYKQAYEYSDRAITIRDANYSAETNSAIRDVETKYRIDQIQEKQQRENQKHREEQSRGRKILLIVIAVFILTLILLYFFYQNNRLKQKNKLREIESAIQQNILTATIDGQETERKKIASVLHDNISAMLSSAGLQLTAFASGQQKESEEIVKTRQILKEAHDQVRALSHELVPALLAKFGLSYALQDLCEKNSNKAISFDYSVDGSIKRYDEDFEMKVYFIVSELLNNVLKHSQATRATLSLSGKRRLTVTVEDNGKGFNTGKPFSGEGFGLTQIRARINGLGGNFTVTSKPNSGTLVHFSVPIPVKKN